MIFSIFMDLSAKSKKWSFFLLGSSVLLSIFLPPKASAFTYVPGISSYISIPRKGERIERILDKHPRLKEQVKNQLHSYYLCRYEKVLEKEKKEKSNLCTDLYRALVKEKIWFQDNMLWEIVNYTEITKSDPTGKETCYDAKLLGIGDGIKCYRPEIIDSKTGKPKKFTVYCSKQSLREIDKKTREDFFSFHDGRKLDSISNVSGIWCSKSAKEGSQLYRRLACSSHLIRGEEDKMMGLLVGKYCRDNFPESITANRYSFGVNPVENRKKIQRKIAQELVKFKSKEKRSFESDYLVHKDLMSNKYTLKDKKFYCMDAAVNDFANEPKFYKEYCNKLMK